LREAQLKKPQRRQDIADTLATLRLCGSSPGTKLALRAEIPSVALWLCGSPLKIPARTDIAWGLALLRRILYAGGHVNFDTAHRDSS
jgi:hypothetical protein